MVTTLMAVQVRVLRPNIEESSTLADSSWETMFRPRPSVASTLVMSPAVGLKCF